MILSNFITVLHTDQCYPSGSCRPEFQKESRRFVAAFLLVGSSVAASERLLDFPAVPGTHFHFLAELSESACPGMAACRMVGPRTGRVGPEEGSNCSESLRVLGDFADKRGETDSEDRVEGLLAAYSFAAAGPVS